MRSYDVVVLRDSGIQGTMYSGSARFGPGTGTGMVGLFGCPLGPTCERGGGC